MGYTHETVHVRVPVLVNCVAELPVLGLPLDVVIEYDKYLLFQYNLTDLHFFKELFYFCFHLYEHPLFV